MAHLRDDLLLEVALRLVLLLVHGDVDGHGVVAQRLHLVGRQVLVRRLGQRVLIACNANAARVRETQSLV
jgi:hypothetical protein